MRRTLLAAAALALAGCGGGGDDSGPTERQIFLVQSTGEASGAMTRLLSAANAGVLAAGSTSPTPGPHAVPVYPGATPAFNFNIEVDQLFDFDAADPDGNDLDPNASGQIRVIATGATTGDEFAGTATFSVSVTAETDLEFTNPDTGVVTTIPGGAAWTYDLTVVWTFDDSKNWSVTATALTTVDVQNVVVDDGTTTVNIDVVGQREVVSSFSRTNGKVSHERSFDGSLTTTIDDGTSVETVVIEYTKPGHVRISVLGSVFGPMTEGKARDLFQTVIN
jgi:hypothetical protein